MHVYTCNLVCVETHVQPLYIALWIIQYTWIHMVGDMTNRTAMCVILHKLIKKYWFIANGFEFNSIKAQHTPCTFWLISAAPVAPTRPALVQSIPVPPWPMCVLHKLYAFTDFPMHMILATFVVRLRCSFDMCFGLVGWLIGWLACFKLPLVHQLFNNETNVCMSKILALFKTWCVCLCACICICICICYLDLYKQPPVHNYQPGYAFPSQAKDLPRLGNFQSRSRKMMQVKSRSRRPREQPEKGGSTMQTPRPPCKYVVYAYIMYTGIHI